MKRKRTPPAVECYTEPTIKIIVGPDEVEFHVHRERLCHYSTYFEAALSGDWKESQDCTIKLEECEMTFRYFVDWLYSGEFNGLEADSNVNPCRELYELWVFGDKRGVPLLQNAVIDALHQEMHSFDELDTDDIAFVYDNTAENAKLRALLVEIYAAQDIRAVFTAENEYPKTFLYDVLRRVGSNIRPFRISRMKEYWASLDTSVFYEHLESVTGEAKSPDRATQHIPGAPQLSPKSS